MNEANPAESRAEERPLHLALVTVEYPPDPGSYGLGTYTQALARALVRRGHTVHVLARSPQGDRLEREGALSVHRLGPARPEVDEGLGLAALAGLALRAARGELRYRRKLAARLEQLITLEGLDLVEAPDATAEALLYQPRRHPHIPFVVKLHGPFAVAELFDRNLPEALRRLVRALERRQLLRATHLSVPSSTVVPLFRRELGLRGPLHVLANPPPYALFPTPEPAPAQERDPNLVLFAGRVAPMKGVDLFVGAIPAVLERFPAARFVVAGGDAVSEARFAASRRALYASLPERARGALHFAGRLPYGDLAELYARAALCVFPSRYEPFGYTCLEAMRFGNAVVGSDHGGMRELLDEGRAGRLVRAEVGAVASAVLELLADPALRETLGERARERAQGVFGEAPVLAATERFYRRTIAERAHLR